MSAQTLSSIFWPLLFLATPLPPLRAQTNLPRPLTDFPEAKTADSLARAGENRAAQAFLLQAKDLLERGGSQASLCYVSVLRALGEFYFENELGTDSARLFLDNAARRLPQIDPNRKADLAALFHLLGRTHYADDNPNKARVFFEKSLPLWLASVGENHLRTARCYNALAVCYNYAGNFEKSIACGQKALRSLKKATAPENPEIGTYTYNIGLTFYTKGDFAEALTYFEEALKTLLKNRGEHETTAKCLSLLGSTQASLKNGPAAIEYQHRALDMFRQITDSTDGIFFPCYLALGTAYTVNHQLPEAVEFYKKALWFNVPAGQMPPERPEANLALAITYLNLHQLEPARSHVETALRELHCQHPLRLDSLIERSYTYRALLTKAALLAEGYSRTHDLTQLRAAGEALADAKTVILARIGEFYQEKNKLVFFRRAVDGNTQAISVNAQLFAATGDLAWLRSAFEYSEISKSLLLFQSVLENQSRRKFSVPDSLVVEEDDLKKSITATELEIENSKPETQNSKLETAQERLFNLKNRYENLRRQIETVCPDYFRAAAEFPRETLESARQLLPDDSTALLEYFTADSFLCLFLLRRDTFYFQKSPLDSSLAEQVRQWRASICGYFVSPEKTPESFAQNAARFAEIGHALYQKLLAPLAEHLPRKLLIVPDGPLGYLPFEALLTAPAARPDRLHSLPYLIRKHEISYCYSAALLREMQKPSASGPPPETLLAMAPFDHATAEIEGQNLPQNFSNSGFASAEMGDSLLPKLPHSGQEAALVAAMSQGKFLGGAAATKAEFVQRASQFRRLHLATHARANDRAGEFSFLAFSKTDQPGEWEPLHVSEIYNLRLAADLVVLSACETGLGQLQRGEGIISLARAFAAAGAHSIVPTLWVVNDAKTRALMEFFYQHLRDGQPTAAALRKAKLDFLKKFRGEEASPFFWSGFVLVGRAR